MSKSIAEMVAGKKELARQFREMADVLDKQATELVAMMDPATQPITLIGRELREMAYDVLGEATLHYKEIRDRIEKDGMRVGGVDPNATLLTQLKYHPGIEPLGNRSGNYRRVLQG